MMHCGACGGIMRAGGHNVYQCGTAPELPTCGKVRIQKSDTDALIEAAVLYRLQSPVVAKAMTAPKRKRTKRADDPERLQAELDELAELTGRGELPMREFLRIRKGIEERLARARAQSTDTTPAAAKALMEAPDVRKAWAKLDTDQRRRIIGELVDRITIAPGVLRARQFDPDRIDIRWKV